MTEETVNINGKSLNFDELQVEFIELESKIDNYKNWIDSLNNKCEELIDAKTRLEQENKELKEKITSLVKIGQSKLNIIEYYWKALEEIRELAKNGNAIDGIRLKIIDKINEVTE